MKRVIWGVACALGVGLVAIPRGAFAYPSSIVFAPTAESLAFGELSLYGYSGVILRRDESVYPSPFVNPWMGAQLGILPAFEYGGGVGFGGLEIGGDIIQLGPAAKGILNAKAQLLTETKVTPSFGVGIMDVFPGNQAESLNMFYVMLTKTLDVSEKLNLGRLHAGYANALNSDQMIFYGTSPFSVADRHAILAGYESPSVGPFYLAVDHVGGVSEVSCTNFALSWAISDSSLFMVGYTMSNDGNAPYDGVFVNLGVGTALFGGDEGAPAGSEGSAPATATPPPSGAPAAAAPQVEASSTAPVTSGGAASVPATEEPDTRAPTEPAPVPTAP